MKKLISVLIASIILLLSVCSVNAFAATPKTDVLLNKLENATEVSVTLRAGETKLFGIIPAQISNTIAIKGNNICYQYNAGFINARIVANEDGIYGFMPTLPYFYVKMDFNPIKGADVWSMVLGAADLTQALTRYLKSYEETVNGTSYYVEEYDDREFVTSKFYYVGDDLKMLVVTDSSTDSVQCTYFDEISFKVDDSMFNTPKMAFDLTPLLKAFFLSLIAA
ncbi:MAG: hypothetical protein IJE72_01265 [Clostridia bacterium]|nr:hypothetical protein [Clostridia bacterium]MBQ4603277.1 hypothetical protein [Clostridia bacterium]